MCFFITFSLYGLLRHLLLGPSWGWYLLGGVAAGLGVITKGVGFLPLLILVPFFLMRGSWLAGTCNRRWRKAGLALVAGAAGMLLGIALWFVPMLMAVEA